MIALFRQDGIDPLTGEVRTAELFIAVLGASKLHLCRRDLGKALPDCLTANGGLCHEASTRRVTPTQVPTDNFPGGILPPLVNRAVGAH